MRISGSVFLPDPLRARTIAQLRYDAAMPRANILLDPEIHEALRRRAFDEKKSISEVARQILREALCGKLTKRSRRAAKDPLLGLIGIVKGDGSNVSERHDDYLNEGKRW